MSSNLFLVLQRPWEVSKFNSELVKTSEQCNSCRVDKKGRQNSNFAIHWQDSNVPNWNIETFTLYTIHVRRLNSTHSVQTYTPLNI